MMRVLVLLRPQQRVAAWPRRMPKKSTDFLDKPCGPRKMGIGNENDQVSKGHLVDALACTGDEGRDTLR